MKNNEANLRATVKKAYLIFTDYTMATEPEDRDALLEILATYIYDLGDPRAILMYSKVCDSDDNDRETYVEILGDILISMSPEN